MKILNASTFFANVPIGSSFCASGSVYIKISPYRKIAETDKPTNAINLSNGCPAYYSDNYEVTKINMHNVVEKNF